MSTKQSGLILPVVLFFLIVFGGLLLRASQTVNIELLLTRYLQDEVQAFLAAESALSKARHYLTSASCNWPAFDQDRTDGLFVSAEEILAHQINWLTQAQSLEANTNFEHLAQAPAYSIQYLVETATEMVATKAQRIRWFRIISRGVSSSSSHVVLLESLIGLQYQQGLDFASADKKIVQCCWREIFL